MKNRAKEQLFKANLTGQLTSPALIAGIRLVEWRFASKIGLKGYEISQLVNILSNFYTLLENGKHIVLYESKKIQELSHSRSSGRTK